jgi:hypothetical protein
MFDSEQMLLEVPGWIASNSTRETRTDERWLLLSLDRLPGNMSVFFSFR